MSFVPVTGPARLLVGRPPREGSVEFTDERRTIVMPIRGALPVLGKVRDQTDVHPVGRAARRGCADGPAAGRLGPLRPGPRRSALAGRGARRRRRAPHRRAGPLPGLRRLRRGDRRGHGPRPARRRRRHDAPHHPGPLAPPRPDARRSAAVGAAQPRRVQRPAAAADRPHPCARTRRPAAPGVHLVPRRGRRGGAGRRRRAPGAAGPRRRQRRPPRRRLASCGPSPVRRRATASASGPAPTPPSRCAPRPTPGRSSTGCSTCGSPTRSPSTPTRSSRCSTAAPRR